MDGITVERFAKDSPKGLLAIKEQLQAGNHQPKPVKRVWIPKPGSTEKRPPQGGVISPLLANIYLNELDWQMKNQGIEMIRYADDRVVMCRDTEAAQQALEKIKEWMAKARLELHPVKTKLVDSSRRRNRQSPTRSKMLTREPDAGNRPVRFGGRGGINIPFLPLSIS